MLLDTTGKEVYIDAVQNKKIIFYGASTRNKRAIEVLGISENVAAFIDRDQTKTGSFLDGYVILSVNALENLNDCVIISVLSECFRDVLTILRQYGKADCLFYLEDTFDYVKYANSNKKILDNQRTFKYVHIFPNEKFVKPFYNMLEDHFDMKEHAFIIDCSRDSDTYQVYDFIDEKNKIYQNIIVIDDIHSENNLIHLFSDWSCNAILASKQFELFIEKAEKIYLHSAFLGMIGRKRVSEMAEKAGRKMIWLCWGSDALYEEDSYIVKNILQKVSESYCEPAKVEVIKNRYKINVQGNTATYCYIKNKNEDAQLKEMDSIKILLGHSAIAEMCHMYGMELLYPYRNEEIQVYCPLSYGDKAYADQVIAAGKEMFGEKFIPLLDFIEPYAYYAFLSEIDVAVFPMKRSFGLTTLTYLNAIGKKIYVCEQLVKDFKCYGINAQDIAQIKGMNYEEFIKNDAASCSQQKEIGKLNEEVLESWKNILC